MDPKIIGLRRDEALQVKFCSFDSSLASLPVFKEAVYRSLGLDLFHSSLELSISSSSQAERYLVDAECLSSLSDGDVVTVRESPRCNTDIWGSSIATSLGTTGTGLAELLHSTHLHVGRDGRLIYSAPGLAPRAPTLSDVLPCGALRLPSVGRLVCALAQSALISATGLAEVAVGNAPPVLASLNWASAETLYVLVPTAGSATGLWSTLASLLIHVHDGSMLPLLLALTGAGSRAGATLAAAASWSRSGPGSVGVIATCPYSQEPEDPSSWPRSNVYFKRVWDALVSRAAAHSVVMVAHGFGADLVLSLLADVHYATAVQRRVRAVALIEPHRVSGAVLAKTATSGSQPTHLKSFLSEKTFTWYCDPFAAPATFLEDGPAHVDALVTHLGVPFVSPDGCHSQNVRLVVSGLSLEESSSPAALRTIAAAFLPAGITHQISALTAYLLADSSHVVSTFSAPPLVFPMTQRPPLHEMAPFFPSVKAVSTSAVVAAPSSAASLVMDSGSPATLPSVYSEFSNSTKGNDVVNNADAALKSVASRHATIAILGDRSTETTSSSVQIHSFVSRPVLSPKYEAVCIDASSKLISLYDDAFLPGGGTKWKISGQKK